MADLSDIKIEFNALAILSLESLLGEFFSALFGAEVVAVVEPAFLQNEDYKKSSGISFHSERGCSLAIWFGEASVGSLSNGAYLINLFQMICLGGERYKEEQDKIRLWLEARGFNRCAIGEYEVIKNARRYRCSYSLLDVTPYWFVCECIAGADATFTPTSSYPSSYSYLLLREISALFNRCQTREMMA